MKLNKDGTATLEVAGKPVTLRSPTWGELKALKSKYESLSEPIGGMISEKHEALSDEAKTVWTLIRTSKTEDAWRVQFEELPPEDQDALNNLGTTLKESVNLAREVAVAWWVNVIGELGGETVTSDDIPAGLANSTRVDQYIVHVETVPFDSGL